MCSGRCLVCGFRMLLRLGGLSKCLGIIALGMLVHGSLVGCGSSTVQFSQGNRVKKFTLQ